MRNETGYLTASQIIQLGNIVTWLRNKKLQPYALTSSQCETIRFILKHDDEEITAGRVMEELKLSQSTVAGILKRLEAKGLILRSTQPGDGRKSRIVPTRLGEQLRDALIQTGMETERQLLQGLTEQEQTQFKATLDVVLHNMEQIRMRGEAQHGN